MTDKPHRIFNEDKLLSLLLRWRDESTIEWRHEHLDGIYDEIDSEIKRIVREKLHIVKVPDWNYSLDDFYYLGYEVCKKTVNDKIREILKSMGV